MNVCLVTREYPPETGRSGVGTYMHSIAHALQELGNKVIVVSYSNKRSYETKDGKVDVFRIKPKNYSGLWRLNKWIPMWHLGYSAAVYDKLKKLHGRFRFDIIQFPEWGGEGFFFSRKPFCPFVIKVHGPMFLNHQFDRNPQSFLLKCTQNWIEKSAVLKANAIIVSSRSMMSVTNKNWDIPNDRMTLVPNPININLFKPSSAFNNKNKQRNEVLCVGRLEYRKGVHVLAKAIPLILKNCSLILQCGVIR